MWRIKLKWQTQSNTESKKEAIKETLGPLINISVAVEVAGPGWYDK